MSDQRFQEFLLWRYTIKAEKGDFGKVVVDRWDGPN
jgi:hypothetical protein